MQLNRTYIIAEIGGNFTDFKTAKKLIDLAAACKVDAIKLQTYRADTLATKQAFFEMENTGITSQYDLFKRYEISETLHQRIFKYAGSKHLDWLSTPSHPNDVDMLERLGVKIYKIGSDDAVNIPFLKYIAKKNKPIIMATGMCTMQEVRNSVNVITRTGNKKLILLHAVTSYPTHPTDVNLLALKTMMQEFPNYSIGYSDHTLGINACLAAAALGAKVIEKHFTYDKKAKGPDHMISADAAEMDQLVRGVREIEVMLGDGIKRPAPGEKLTRLNNRKSIVVEKSISKGKLLTTDNLAVKRPGRGLGPNHYERILGKKALHNLLKDSLLSLKDFR